MSTILQIDPIHNNFYDPYFEAIFEFFNEYEVLFMHVSYL